MELLQFPGQVHEESTEVHDGRRSRSAGGGGRELEQILELDKAELRLGRGSLDLFERRVFEKNSGPQRVQTHGRFEYLEKTGDHWTHDHPGCQVALDPTRSSCSHRYINF